MDVKGFELLKFDARLLNEDRWLEVHTKPGSGPDDEWVEILGGITREKGVHFHEGINKDATLRFVKKRGVLKSTKQRAEDSHSHRQLDATEEVWGEGKFAIKVALLSNRISKKVWVSEVKLVRRDLTSELD
jgi:hypothetical protein